MAEQEDIDRIRREYGLEFSLIGYETGSTVTLVLVNGRIHVLLSRLLFVSEDPVDIESFIAAAAKR